MSTARSLRATWLALRRSGPRRSLYRLRRRFRLRLVDPLLASRLYPLPVLSERSLSPGTVDQLQLLKRLVVLRQAAPMAECWDQTTGALSLLNQPRFPLVPPVDWAARPMADPLWAFHLHGWEWAWPWLDDTTSWPTLLALWRDWVACVPIGRGLAWEPHPTSRRLVVWSAAWHLAGGDHGLAGAVAQHAAYVADHLERDLDNNHLVANAKALAWVGLLFPGLPQAQRWRDRGLGVLWDALRDQVRGDGGHVENSTSYHLAVWLDWLETALLCRASGQAVPPAIWDTLARMGDFVVALLRPDGRLPLLNDSIQDEPVPVCSVLALAAEALGRPDWVVPAGNSRALPDSGYVVFHSGASPEDTYLVFDVGNLGPAHCPGHGHADALSIELWSQGEALVLDPGTYQYAAGPWRDYFRGAAAHSTAVVDGLDQSCFVGPFRVAEMAHGRLVSSRLDGPEPEAVGEHDGYTRLPNPVTHRRRVRMFDSGHIAIEDTFSGAELHKIALYFHLAPCEVVVSEPGVVCATYPGGTRVWFHLDSPIPAELSIQEGWISQTWYRRQPSPVLVYTKIDQLPSTITTHIHIR
ncbi:MAG: heparinase II/III family protein [Chloroflexi bacterium]|nr:heparinase II/III family protein [Chloroflexota bacterium]MBU1749941.1 heparinase II/III family protein [Chloroflexota bacterium]